MDGKDQDQGEKKSLIRFFSFHREEVDFMLVSGHIGVIGIGRSEPDTGGFPIIKIPSPKIKLKLIGSENFVPGESGHDDDL